MSFREAAGNLLLAKQFVVTRIAFKTNCTLQIASTKCRLGVLQSAETEITNESTFVYCINISDGGL